MDANRTKYWMLLGRDDWKSVSIEPGITTGDFATDRPPLEWNTDQKSLGLTRTIGLIPAVPGGLELKERPGADADRYGSFYSIAPSRRSVLVRSSGTGNVTHYWGLEDRPIEEASDCDAPAFRGVARAVDLKTEWVLDGLRFTAQTRLRGVAVTSWALLLVGVVNPAGLLIFDLHAGGQPRALSTPFTPYDIDATPDGGAYVIDEEAQQLWRIGRSQRVLSWGRVTEEELTFQPSSGAERRRLERPVRGRPSADLGAAAGGPVHPTAVAAVNDCIALVLDVADEGSRVWMVAGDRVDGPHSLNPKDALIAKHRDDPDLELLPRHDLLFVGEPSASANLVEGLIHVPTTGWTQVFTYKVSIQLPNAPLLTDATCTIQPQGVLHPVRTYDGHEIVELDGKVYYSTPSRWVRMEDLPVRSYEREGTFRRLFEGDEPGTVWHRVMFDGLFPEETGIRIRTRAADERDDLELMPWTEQAQPYIRETGRELPFLPHDRCTRTAETFLHEARGRYLEVSVTLRGVGISSPFLAAMRVWYPRFSYAANYLPAVYRDDTASARFVEGFLGNIEGFFTGIEDRIASVQVLFDSKSAPREALDWLAGWLGLALEPQWSEEKRRLMIRHAVAFYRLRGTIAGLDLALRLAFEDPVDPDVFRCLEQGRIPVGRLRSIRMLEEFRVRMTPRILLGDPTVDDAPILVSLEQAWDPSQDIATLDQRYQERTGDPGRSYPLSPPSDEAERPVWERFSMEVLGFVPSAKATDLSRWRDYLRRQYRGIERLRGAHGTGYLDFDDIPLPKDDRPVTESARRDWFRFESVVVPTARSAHRFSVFVPAPEQLGAHPMREAEIVKLARRVVELEKPAHTTFTVDLYFAVVRLGRVRLGYDTVVGPGSRTPWLTPELLVGQVAVGEGWIPPRSKDQATERFVVGDRALSQDNRI